MDEMFLDRFVNRRLKCRVREPDLALAAAQASLSKPSMWFPLARPFGSTNTGVPSPISRRRRQFEAFADIYVYIEYIPEHFEKFSDFWVIWPGFWTISAHIAESSSTSWKIADALLQHFRKIS